MQNSLSSNGNDSNSYKTYVTKSGFFLLILILIAVQNNVQVIKYSFTCFYDLGVEATMSVAKSLSENPTLRHTLIIISSLLIDTTILTTMVIWILKGKSWRFFFTGVCFYGVRAILQFTFMMPFPDYYTFDYPGFPSIMVSYKKTNDFFYSGHVGIPLICGYEFYMNKEYIITIVCVCISIFQGSIMLIHHAHYGVDLIIGMICAHYFSKLTDTYIKYIDNSCISINENINSHSNLNYLIEGSKNEI
jgi:hypothetical protein